jgi:AcrR family transcriptional regulator
MTVKASPKARMSSEERKACIVQAACKLFSEKGFRGVTTRELASAVGVTEPVLYEHFKTKRDLYSAIIEGKAQEGVEVVGRIRDKFAESPDDYAFFVNLADSILDWYIRDPAFIRLLLFSNLEGDELKDLFHERSRECMEIVSSYITKRIQDGAMREVDPFVAARAFFGMVAHYAMTAVIFGVTPIHRPTGEVVHEMVSILIGGLCKQEKQQ